MYHSQRFDYQEMDLYWPVSNDETGEWIGADFARVADVGHDVRRPGHQTVQLGAGWRPVHLVLEPLLDVVSEHTLDSVTHARQCHTL